MNSEEKPDNESQPLVISSRLLSSRPILLIWIILFVAALISYCLWNEPLRRAAIHLLPLITSFGFLLSICGIGFPLARRLAGEQDRLMQGITATVFGMGLTAVFVFILGMAGHLSPIWLWSWVILGAVLFLVACFLWRPFNLSVSLRNGWTILSACVLTAFLGMSLPFVVAPEVSTDALSYHLLIPKLYLTLGKVAHLPLFVESNYPSLAEYNYLLILRLSDEIVCKCFHFWVTVLLLLCLSCVVRKITDRGSSLLAPALFLSMPVTAIHMGWAWNDFIYTLMIVLSLFYLLNYHLATDKTRAGNDLLVAGLMAGLASWTKYTFAIFFFAILPLLLLGVRKWNWNNRKSLLFFAGILVVAPFWLVQNWIFTGNPVYPFLNHVFQSPYWTETANAYFHSALRRWEIQDWNWTTYFTFPVFITLKPRLVDVHTGILPLVLLPFLFAKSLNKGMTFLKYFVLSCTIVWLLIQTETRSLLSLFAVLFCVVSVCIQHWDWPGRFWKMAFAGFIILAVACNFVITMLTTYHLSDPVKYFVGLETKPQYLRRQIGSQAVYEYLNSEKKVRKVMLVGFHDPFYLKHPFLFSSFTDPPVAEVLTHDAGSEADIRAKLRSLGVTHIALDLKNYERENKEGLYSWSAEKRARFQSFIQNECRQIARFGDDIIFELK